MKKVVISLIIFLGFFSQLNGWTRFLTIRNKTQVPLIVDYKIRCLGAPWENKSLNISPGNEAYLGGGGILEISCDIKNVRILPAGGAKGKYYEDIPGDNDRHDLDITDEMLRKWGLTY